MNIVQQNDRLFINGHEVSKIITVSGKEILIADLFQNESSSILSKIKTASKSGINVSNVSCNSNVIIQQ